MFTNSSLSLAAANSYNYPAGAGNTSLAGQTANNYSSIRDSGSSGAGGGGSMFQMAGQVGGMAAKSAKGSIAMTAGIIGTVLSYKSMADKLKAIKAEATLKANEVAKDTTAVAAQQKVSFLNSGIALTGEAGTTSANYLKSTYAAGLEDINLINKNYNTVAKNTLAEGRSQYISNMASVFSSSVDASGF